MANGADESLREFADIIQEKAGPVPEPETGDGPRPVNLPGWWIAGIMASLGIVIGYLLGKRRHP